MEKPEGFEVHGRDSHVCMLKNSLYRLKQSPRPWYSRIDSYLQSMGFQKSEVDPNLYYVVVGGDSLILMLYVNDLLIKSEERLIASCKRDLSSKYEMTDIELLHYYLGMEVWQEPSHIFLGQGKYTIDVLWRFQMKDCRSMATLQ